MKEWLIWRVGSGEQIKNFHDKWIPHEVVRMTYTPRRGLFEDAMVADLALLTCNDTRWWKWNASLLAEVIEGDGAAKIGQIPISMYNGSDQQIWKYSATGEFTVRIAYHLANSCATYDRGECSYATRHTDTWKSIWKMEVPNVVKVFMWIVEDLS